MVEQDRSASHSFRIPTRGAPGGRDKSTHRVPQTKCSTPPPPPRSACPYSACFYGRIPAEAQRHPVQRELERVLRGGVHAEQQIEQQLTARSGRRSDVREAGRREQKAEQLERIQQNRARLHVRRVAANKVETGKPQGGVELVHVVLTHAAKQR